MHKSNRHAATKVLPHLSDTSCDSSHGNADQQSYSRNCMNHLSRAASGSATDHEVAVVEDRKVNVNNSFRPGIIISTGEIRRIFALLEYWAKPDAYSPQHVLSSLLLVLESRIRIQHWQVFSFSILQCAFVHVFTREVTSLRSVRSSSVQVVGWAEATAARIAIAPMKARMIFMLQINRRLTGGSRGKSLQGQLQQSLKTKQENVWAIQEIAFYTALFLSTCKKTCCLEPTA